MELDDQRVKDLQKLGWKFVLDEKQGWIVHDPNMEEFQDFQGNAWRHLSSAVRAAEKADERIDRPE
jgi:hypothetical protein